jgi:hypothetical protein
MKFLIINLQSVCISQEEIHLGVKEAYLAATIGGKKTLKRICQAQNENPNVSLHGECKHV